MNRNSKLAKALSAQTGIRARRIETWTIEGLGPDPLLLFEEQLPHYLELDKIAGPGRSNNYDLAARRLAAHGFKSSRLRTALLSLVIDESNDNITMLIDRSTEESVDAMYREYDSVATSLVSSVDALPPALRLVVQKLRQNAYQGSASTNETGDQVFHSAVVSLLNLFNGGEVLNGEATAAMLGFDPTEFDMDAFTFIEQLGLTFQNLEHAYRTMSLEDIVAMAEWLRDHILVAAEYFGITKAPDSVLDDLATQFAPMVACLIEPLVNECDGFAAFLVEIGVPDRLIPLSLPR
jgi:hypothetical protein